MFLVSSYIQCVVQYITAMFTILMHVLWLWSLGISCGTLDDHDQDPHDPHDPHDPLDPLDHEEAADPEVSHNRVAPCVLPGGVVVPLLC